MLHLDIKPANAILSDGGEVKLVDFGLAEFVGRAGRVEVSGSLIVPTVDDGAPPAPSVVKNTDSDSHEHRTDPTVPGAGDGKPVNGQRANGIDMTLVVHNSRPVAPPAVNPADLVAPAIEDVTRTEAALISSRGSGNGSKRIWGTPRYMAPEIWCGEPASRASDVYSLGILMFELCAGRTPFVDTPVPNLGRVVNEREAPSLIELQPAVDSRLAAIVGRCLRMASGARFASGGELRDALEGLVQTGDSRRIPEGNPYRGLLAFESEHSGLFFGRRSEIGSVVQRLRSDPLVVVTGDSGAGKSSLCRAGVLPLIEDGALEGEREWIIARMIPGRHPLDSLARTLSAALAIDLDDVTHSLRAGQIGLGKLLRRRLGRAGALALFVDQFEELTTVSDADQAARTCDILNYFTARTRQLRLLATVRADFLVQVGNLPSIGESITRALYMLRPMSSDKVREAIVEPARVKGVEFESETLVDDLVRSATSSQGGLPLLQFALAELWDVRKSDKAPITSASLNEIGGVAGALARHADRVIGRLDTEQTIAARRILMSLVTPTGTRARRSKHELGAEEIHTSAALEALVHGRLIMVREAAKGALYELAHEALLHDWQQLRTWLDSHADQREAKERLERAVAEWERLGGKRAGLWGRVQLEGDAAVIDRKTLTTHEAAFLDASRRAVKRGRFIRRGLLIAVPLLVLLVYAAQIKASNDAARAAQREAARVRNERVAARLQVVDTHYRAAEQHRKQFNKVRSSAIEAYKSMNPDEGERLWQQTQGLYEQTDHALAKASQELEYTIGLDSSRTDVRDRLGEVLTEQAELAESMWKDKKRDDLVARIAASYDDDGTRIAQWTAPVTLSITTKGVRAQVTIARYQTQDSGHLVLGEPSTLGVTPLVGTVPRGSYVLTLTANERYPARYPLYIRRDEEVSIQVDMPLASQVPEGYVYIPEGEFLFGSDVNEFSRRDMLEAPPMYKAFTSSYVIGRYETTVKQWIRYLENTNPEVQSRLYDAVESGTIKLRRQDGTWHMNMQFLSHNYILKEGEKLVYENREVLREQDWMQLPATGMNFDEALAYTDWLNEKGGLPGAHPCTEYEWERAARGADRRGYPHGLSLTPDEANYDETHDKDPARSGPDIVGSYPISKSPFGVKNMAGNVSEWTWSSLVRNNALARGGSFFTVKINTRVDNRTKLNRDIRTELLGLRICAPFPLVKQAPARTTP